MELDEEYILEILVDAAMVAERLTPSDFDQRYRIRIWRVAIDLK
jgi:hypothetical protein